MFRAQSQAAWEVNKLEEGIHFLLIKRDLFIKNRRLGSSAGLRGILMDRRKDFHQITKKGINVFQIRPYPYLDKTGIKWKKGWE